MKNVFLTVLLLCVATTLSFAQAAPMRRRQPAPTVGVVSTPVNPGFSGTKNTAVPLEQRSEAMNRRREPVTKRFVLASVKFETNRAVLTPEAKITIKAIAAKINNYDYKLITIEGHSDSTGSMAANNALSKARAKSVFDELAKNGINKSNMRYKGFGSTMHIDTNNTRAGRERNRRVEIFVE